MLCVYCFPTFLLCSAARWDKQRNCIFLVLTAQLSDVLQYVFGKLCGRRPIAPRLSPHKTWEGFVGGVLTASAVATGLWWATPFAPWQAALLALVICLSGFAGGLVMSAIKRDLGAKDWGQGIAGHGGVLDRVDSLVFSAPLFFHLCGFFFGSGFDPSPPDWLARLVGR
jgi:phosphatidate cytidylyltransferase